MTRIKSHFGQKHSQIIYGEILKKVLEPTFSKALSRNLYMEGALQYKIKVDCTEKHFLNL